MTGGLGVSKRLKLSLVFLPVIVLACLFRPAGFVSAWEVCGDGTYVAGDQAFGINLYD